MAFITVTGEVTRTFYNGRGAEVTESFTAGGKEIKKRWACWFESEHGLSEGQAVEVSGIHSDQVDPWEDKEGNTRHAVKRSINKTKIKSGNASGGSQAAPQPATEEPWAASATTPTADTWNVAPEFSGDVPF